MLTKMMSSSSLANPEKNYLPMPVHHKEILTLAERIYDDLLKAAVNNTIPLTSTPTINVAEK
jgi:hypothetical protein